MLNAIHLHSRGTLLGEKEQSGWKVRQRGGERGHGAREKFSRAVGSCPRFRGWGPAQPLGVSRDSWFPKAPLKVGKDGHRSEQLTVLKMNKFLIYNSD